MARIYYTVEDRDFDDYLHVDAELALGGEWIAEICAEDYHDNSNWENADSLTFYLWTRKDEEDPVLLGEYLIYREFSPTFYACPQNTKE